ncbi:unnamed protein product, partial [Rotaria magnacalcarata]
MTINSYNFQPCIHGYNYQYHGSSQLHHPA